MPRPRKTEQQRRTERFCERYRIGKARIGASEKEISAIIGVSYPTVLEMRKDPGRKVSLDDFVKFGKIFGWSDEDYLAIIHAERGAMP